jgi:MFS family permease
MAITFLASLGTSVFWNGLSFVAKHDYGYTQKQNLLLYLSTGIVYVFGAANSGRLTRLVERRLSPRGVLMMICVVMAAACPLVLFGGGSWPLWVVANLSSLTSAMYWPIVESFLTAGRHGARMRWTLGWWNLAWTTAVATALFLMAPLAEGGQMKLAILMLTPLNLLTIGLLFLFPKVPAAHGQAEEHGASTVEYPLLLRCARVLLPTSYLLIGTLSPVMPYLLQQLKVDVSYETPMAAVWTIARIIAMAAMWRLAFWHGRWGTLVVGGLALAGGFAMAVLAPTVLTMIIGLAIFGAGIGIVYYAAIYYAMTVGHAEVDAGGTHEALIGMGYAVGPVVGLVGLATGGGEPLTLSIVLGMMALAVIPAAKPYLTARSNRRQRATSIHST